MKRPWKCHYNRMPALSPKSESNSFPCTCRRKHWLCLPSLQQIFIRPPSRLWRERPFRHRKTRTRAKNHRFFGIWRRIYLFPAPVYPAKRCRHAVFTSSHKLSGKVYGLSFHAYGATFAKHTCIKKAKHHLADKVCDGYFDALPWSYSAWVTFSGVFCMTADYIRCEEHMRPLHKFCLKV